MLSCNIFAQKVAKQIVYDNEAKRVAGDFQSLQINGTNGGLNFTMFYTPEFYEGVEGSPYLNEEWKQGTILLNGNEKIEGLQMRYNLYAQTFEVFENNQVYSLTEPTAFELIELENRLFFYNNKERDAKLPTGYFQLIYDGATKLFLKRSIDYLDAKKGTTPYHASVEVPMLIVKEAYFIKNSTGTVIPVGLRQNSILSALADHRSEVKAYVKEKGLKLNKLQNVLILLEYYDTL